MTIPVFYVPQQSAETESYSPSSSKPERVVKLWLTLGLDVIVHPFEPLTREQVKQAHFHEYVDDVLDLKVENGFGNKDPRVSKALLYTNGSITAAARHVLKTGCPVACSPSSGFHHARWAGGGGYCTFNGLMIAAMNVLNKGLARRVGILDYDYHFGDGTEDIIKKLGISKVLHFSAHSRYRNESHATDLILELRHQVRLMKKNGADLLLYQAGADQHVNDPLGGVLTTTQLRERDRIVFETCKSLGMPVVWNLAGGYQEPFEEVLTIHKNTMKECISVFG